MRGNSARIYGGREQYALGTEHRDLRVASSKDPLNAYAPSWSSKDETVGASARLWLIDATGGERKVFLPEGTQVLPVTVKKIDASANAVVLTPALGASIDGASDYSLTDQWSSVTVVSYKGDWYIV